MTNRVTLIAALLGMLLTVHIWIQDKRGFDRGCWGISSQSTQEFEGACGRPELLGVSFLAIRPAAWGYLFYSAVALCAITKSVGSLPARRLAGRAAVALVAVGLFQTGYLLYLQAFQIGAFCPLCVISSFLVAVLCLLQVIEVRSGVLRGRLSEASDLGFVAGSGFATIGLLIALLVASNNPSSIAPLAQPAGTKVAPASEKVAQKKGPIPGKMIFANWRSWGIPPINAITDIPVVVFMDPNCPHCAQVFGQFKALAKEVDGKASLYVFPRIIWEYSTLQAQALELARQSGKYYEMWQAQFDNQIPGGMKPEEIRLLAKQLGIPMEGYDERLASSRRPVTIMSQNAGMIGVTATPVWFVDGTRPSEEFRSWEGVRTLIERAVASRHAGSLSPDAKGADNRETGGQNER